MVSSKPFADIDLRALADLNGPERAFVSLYLSGPAALDTWLERRIPKVRALLTDNPIEQEHFDNTLERVRAHLEAEPLTEGSRVIFASWALDYLKAYRLTAPVPDLLWVDAALYLRPLAELQDEHERFAVVATDNTASRIFLVASARAADEGTVHGDVKNHVRKGGWSQQRYERRRDNELLHYAKEIAERLAHLDQAEGFDRLVLLGSDETMRAIQGELTAQLTEKLVGEKPMNLDLDDDLVWKRGLGMVEEAERASEQALWERVREQFFRGGLAIAGPEDVLAAATVGRVETMLVTRDVKIAGTRCRECQTLVAGTADRCASCQSDDVFVADLVNELVELLALSSATVEFCDPIPGLTEVGDVAALLRY